MDIEKRKMEQEKKKAEVKKKEAAAKRKFETQKNMLEKRLRAGEAVGTKHIDVKYAAREAERRAKELDRLK